MTKEQQELLIKIMQQDFTAYDLHLFLDTHPYDAKALRQFKEAVEASQQLRKEYQATYGPLVASAAANTSPWQWIKSPWNWEKEGNPNVGL